jgi:hypothetical protein
LQQSVGKSTTYDESIAPTPGKKDLLSKKRLFSELEPDQLFHPPLDDRFNSVMLEVHNETKVGQSASLKRAPLNNELIEALELERVGQKSEEEKKEQKELLSKGVRYLKGVSLPIFDKEHF